MENFQAVCSQVKEKLGRQLNERELDFLRWVQNQHMLEATDIKKGNIHQK